MCRIWGISLGPGGWSAEHTTPTTVARRMFAELASGGPHAWGWMAKQGSNLSVQKRKGRADGDGARDRTRLAGRPEWIVGHTRYATHGSPQSHANNHPVRHHRLLGVHNGVLRNHEELLAEAGGRYDPTSAVDTEAIFAAVAQHGVAAGLELVRGTFAVAWTDMDRANSVWIARGRGRPLVFAETEAGSLVWASEARALRRSGLKLTRVVTCDTDGLALRVSRGAIRETVHFTVAPSLAAVPDRGRARRLDPPSPRDWDWTDEDVFDGAYAAFVAQRRGRIMRAVST
jgi:glutamine phosphoribosylpyrophosphate amidotransferase